MTDPKEAEKAKEILNFIEGFAKENGVYPMFQLGLLGLDFWIPLVHAYSKSNKQMVMYTEEGIRAVEFLKRELSTELTPEDWQKIEYALTQYAHEVRDDSDDV